MKGIELSNSLFAQLAGWEAVKRARQWVEAGRVSASEWNPPVLRGLVREGTADYRAGLIIKSPTDAENLCTCRDSRYRGLICAHSVAAGLHVLQGLAAAAKPGVPHPSRSPTPGPNAPSPALASSPKPSARAVRRLAPGVPGPSLAVWMILPPNLPAAMAKGKVMICLEAESDHRRMPLGNFAGGEAVRLDAQDAALLDALEALNGGETPSMVMLDADPLAALLPRLIGHPRLTLGKAVPVGVSVEPVPLPIRATLDDRGEVHLELAGGQPPMLVAKASAWALVDNTLRPVPLPPVARPLLQGPARIPRARIPQFMSAEWGALSTECALTANFGPSDFTLEPAVPRFELHLAGGIAVLQATLSCGYGDRRVTPGAGSADDASWLPDPRVPTRYSTRNLGAERAAIACLERHGFSAPDSNGVRHLKDQDRILTFFARAYPRLEREWKVTLEARLERSTQQHLERIEPRFDVARSGETWFDLTVAYDSSGGERFAPSEIQRLLRSGQNYARLKNGKFALIDTGAVEELQEVLLDCAPEQHPGGYRIASRQAGYLESSIQEQAGWQLRSPAGWKERIASESGPATLTAPDLGSLDAVLRPYQKHGVAWLAFLRQQGFGGILADEMGLGKTLQVLALLHSLHARGQLKGPVLVVCPTSLVFNWMAESARWTPALRTLALSGADRADLFPKIPENQLVVTSYALMRRDTARYRGLEFDTVVLDEAQHIKNRQTQNAAAVKAVRAPHRLVLTGTPLENSVLDLWSIFDFLMPGYLGSAQDFRERYEVPIAREQARASQSRLARRLRPFLLRRLKREVASDLPEKLEQVSYCEMTPEQSGLYRQVLESSRREILETADAPGGGKSRMLVLTALLRLRQICCDARLLAAALEPGGPELEPSGKTELFMELLEEVLDGGHRVLVFSQFTRMLGLLRLHLEAQGIDFCYLDGEVKDRAGVVDRFQRDARVPVFLISLKAGGVGLNLTGADTVIHFDPWWNPAVEAQATDRAHRIGQRNVVTSYKLITRGTVEEKILSLQARKRALTEGVLGDEEALATALSWEEIKDLLEI